ncbi:putative glutamine amidotransferase [Bryocella elongata]|uniref:Putative glutamine amidotransferase n=1 Tax=Bryocella elongata TaxID=863522 RepID=A0A1H5Y0X9_9BACT|nr:gamma-glutamyl-gamma-aminobutyrate hydrolase family protein [Bryocella elongata]SEG17522.1 putative glutamine amidotransferase [Bryocella elongata]
MSDRPRIAIPVPTSIDPDYNQRSWKNYAAAVTAAGGEPVELDPLSTPATLRALIATCDGVVLPGSPADVEPGRYGADRDPGCGPADAAREQTDWMLLDDAESHGKPVLGICYGIQSLNSWGAGTLVQDLSPLPVNHSAGPRVAIAHSVLIAPDSLLGSLVKGAADCTIDGDFLRLPVNSSHHQAVAQPGDGMKMVARCPEDAVVEAVERPWGEAGNWWVLGVQWHPERSVEISEASRRIFSAFMDEARRWSAANRVPAEAALRD